MWRLYGWFTALMLCGSCDGAVSWAARRVTLVNGFRGNDLPNAGNAEVYPQVYSFRAIRCSWNAVYQVTYSTKFLFLSAAQLMMLDRMSDFVTSQGDGARKWWAVGGRTVMAAVVLCNAIGLSAPGLVLPPPFIPKCLPMIGAQHLCFVLPATPETMPENTVCPADQTLSFL